MVNWNFNSSRPPIKRAKEIAVLDLCCNMYSVQQHRNTHIDELVGASKIYKMEN